MPVLFFQVVRRWRHAWHRYARWWRWRQLLCALLSRLVQDMLQKYQSQANTPRWILFRHWLHYTIAMASIDPRHLYSILLLAIQRPFDNIIHYFTIIDQHISTCPLFHRSQCRKKLITYHSLWQWPHPWCTIFHLDPTANSKKIWRIWSPFIWCGKLVVLQVRLLLAGGFGVSIDFDYCELLHDYDLCWLWQWLWRWCWR